ncbi:MAG: ABC-F family ATP-binding cassette domain-containing protein [Selenomonadaceae bacterium]|nr:ABC-F family ATP-binding cassette domain-containing protein [Selenomonadaceae bacterium]
MIQIKNLGLQLAQKEIFSDLNIEVKRGEKLGITGGEGAGKSSLLDILAGRLIQTAGEVNISGEVLTVTGNISADFSELRMAEMSALEKLKRTVRHLNDTEIILLLDEPTKNLDAEGIEWLINFLLERQNLTAVIVSNDRYFLKRTCPKIIRLGNIQAPKINLNCEPLPENSAALEVNNLLKIRAGETLFNHVGFTIRQGQKVALVGKNKLGRSKLLKTLYTAWENKNPHGGAEQGTIKFAEGLKVAYMPQVFSSATAKTELDNLRDSDANFLLLDEPTAFLDLPNIEEFERALQNFKGTIIFSEDDRAFLENVANRIIDVAPSGTVDRISTYEEFLTNETVQQQIREKYSF